jgi:flavin reductase (DIM6/NTAB) family NADH-FMN oxidoreductase RutF
MGTFSHREAFFVTAAPSSIEVREDGLMTTTHRIHDAEEGGLTPDEFKAAFRQHPVGIAVITADAGNGPVAMTASSVFSVSAEPPVLVFSISEQSSAAPTLLAADTLVVHLLTAKNRDLAVLASTSGVDRFADASIWHRLPTGEPVYTDAHAWIRGKVVDRMQIGGSTVVAVHALESSVPDDAATAQPLVYHNRTWHALSESSKLD